MLGSVELFLYFLYELQAIFVGQNSLVLVWLLVCCWVEFVLNVGLDILGTEFSF